MSNDASNYRIQMHLTEQELAQFRALFAEMQSEVLEIFLEAEQHSGFPTANEVINRVRSM
jgi:hypothetical protein